MAKAKKKLIVVVPMPGIFLLDIAGPCDVFAAADKLLGAKCGLDGLISMRRTFIRHMNISPSDYRRTFRTSLQVMEE